MHANSVLFCDYHKKLKCPSHGREPKKKISPKFLERSLFKRFVFFFTLSNYPLIASMTSYHLSLPCHAHLFVQITYKRSIMKWQYIIRCSNVNGMNELNYLIQLFTICRSAI